MRPIFAFIGLFTFVMPHFALAADFSPSQLIEATQFATASFLKASPEQEVSITGFKTWKAGADAKVRIYLAHGTHTMEVNFQCSKSDGATGVSCQELTQ